MNEPYVFPTVESRAYCDAIDKFLDNPTRENHLAKQEAGERWLASLGILLNGPKVQEDR